MTAYDVRISGLECRRVLFRSPPVNQKKNGCPLRDPTAALPCRVPIDPRPFARSQADRRRYWQKRNPPPGPSLVQCGNAASGKNQGEPQRSLNRREGSKSVTGRRILE